MQNGDGHQGDRPRFVQASTIAPAGIDGVGNLLDPLWCGLYFYRIEVALLVIGLLLAVEGAQQQVGLFFQLPTLRPSSPSAVLPAHEQWNF